MRFVLIHGGFHGAWCWSRLISELEQLGHRAIAIDLPGHGQRRDEDSTLALRREAIVDILEPGDVLVGHSGGGFDITLAADAVPDRVGHLVYLAAGLPLEGRPLLEATGGAKSGEDVGTLNETISSTVVQTNARGRMEWTDFAAARDLFFHDCDEDTARWAFGQFSPAPPEILIEPVSLPRFWSAELPRSAIICREDRALPFATSMAFAGRLGVMPRLIAGSHSPFLSRPAELAAMLVETTGDKPISQLRTN